jgi:predicted transcriptional regulator
MKNPSGDKLEKLVFGMFDQMVEGADKYVTKQGSTWLIFTESRKWVIEFTKDKTLWFNYNIFQGELELIGKDCTEERDLIKDWFESRFLNKPKVEETKKRRLCPSPLVKEAHHVDVMKFFDKKMENTIENGVKNTIFGVEEDETDVEDTIQNGVKETRTFNSPPIKSIEDTIENGVKHTIDEKSTLRYVVKDTIQNGVKETQTRMWPPVGAVEDTIQNGVKDIDYLEGLPMEHVEYTIQNGVKQTSHSEDEDLDDVEDTIENGVKHTIDIEFRNKFIIEDTIQNGVKETKLSSTHSPIYVDDAIENGVKHTDYGYDREESYIEDAIENGVKDVRTPGVGDLESTMDFMNENNTLDVQKLLDDVIENGVKEAKENRLSRTISVISTIKNGVKHVEDGDWLDQDERIDDIIENGVKEIKPLPAQDGNRDWGLYYHRQEDRTKPHTEYVKEVIEDSYNHRGRIEGIIRNTNKDGI